MSEYLINPIGQIKQRRKYHPNIVLTDQKWNSVTDC